MKRGQKRKHLENKESQQNVDKGGGMSKSPEENSQRGSMGVAEGWSLGIKDISSASEYYSCVSSSCKFLHGRIRRFHHGGPQTRSPIGQAQEQAENNVLHFQHIFLSHSSYKTCVTSLCVNKEESGIKIYYMKVQMQKGVAISWETEETFMSLEKYPRREERNLPEDVGVCNTSSDVSTGNLLSDSGEEKEYEESTESDSLPGLPDVEERPRAKTPDWLVTMDTGFRCMACCRVFSTLEILQEHVQYGIREGFSCHIFHLTMARLTGIVELNCTQEEEDENEDEEDENEDKEDKVKAEEEKAKEKETKEEPPTGETLGVMRSLSQCPGCMFHSPKDRK
ncbi:protein FAM170A [Suncus etruscus]|uniref:protein FAM170A n=1 Tax=Suncus etruscus TaxID=109475 RepID=UPI00211083CE|nr:protein FAM170A [Suncus etruscus]